jgi:tRNA dimethylallyltransferase
MVPASRVTPPIHPVAIVTGTTASGKTGIALEFARSFPRGEIEIVNADSLLVFRGFDIGTAKPSHAELEEIPHHLVDVRSPDEAFTAGDFIRECDAALLDIHRRGKRALIVGGTGFYLKALLFGLWDAPKADPAIRSRLELESNPALFDRLCTFDQKAALRISAGDRYRLIRALEMIEISGKTPSEHEAEAAERPSIPGLSLFVVDREAEALRDRIVQRTDQMLEAGFVEEVKALRNAHPDSKALSSVGYAETLRFLDGIPPEGRKILPGMPGLRAEIILATSQLAKRQRTFFGNETQGQFCRASHRRFLTLDHDREELLFSLKTLYSSLSTGETTHEKAKR